MILYVGRPAIAVDLFDNQFCLSQAMGLSQIQSVEREPYRDEFNIEDTLAATIAQSITGKLISQ